PEGTTVYHTFSDFVGPNTIKVTATNSDGTSGPQSSTPITIDRAGIVGTTLLVGGTDVTPGNDDVQLTFDTSADATVVFHSEADVTAGPFAHASYTSVHVDLFGGTNTFTVTGSTAADTLK